MGISNIINAVPNIRQKRYLEIGVAKGPTFDKVEAAVKVGVDPQYPATFAGTSDEFFARNAERFDVIYVDGDHRLPQVLKDYNNSARCLKPGGVLFVHDLIPPDETYLPPDKCGDGWRLLHALLEPPRDLPLVFCHESEYGLTLFLGPQPFDDIGMHISFAQFTKHVSRLRRLATHELTAVLKQWHTIASVRTGP